jgi:DNA-binding response OmpR family regulator
VQLPAVAALGRVLLCEAEPKTGRRVAERFLAEGLHLDRVRGAAEALARLGSGAVDLVLCDRELCDGDGLSVCRAVKDDPATHHVPVVLLCPPEDLEARIAAAEAGADDVFSRTVEPEELVARIRALLRTYLFNRGIWESRRNLKSEVHQFQHSAEKIAHDMRNSLAATLGDVEFVRSRLGQVEPDVVEAVDDVLRALRHLERLTHTLFESR